MIDLVPLKQFSERIASGWTMVSGYDLKARDWAVTMRSPDHVEPKRGNKQHLARICAIDGCEEIHFGRGWCSPHYKRWKRHGDTLGGKFRCVAA